MATQSDLNLAQSLYIAYYGRAADQSGLEFWADKIEEDGLASVLADFGNSAEFQDRFGDLSNEELVDNLYQQLFNRSAEQEGQDFWVGKLESGELNLAEIAHEILQGAQEVDQATLDAKLAAANEYTETAGDDYDLDDGTAAVENAEADQGGQAGEEQALTQRADDLSGTSGDDVFTAPVTQNETGSGELANTFETGDKIDGGEGTDSLEATMIASGAISGAGIVTPPINAETTSVENVFLTAQQSNLVDTGSNPSPILGVSVDAGKMSGVEQWWSDESRADILVEDIRSNPADTAFGMRDTDPGTSFSAYFNANYLEGGSEVGESAFNFTIREQGALGDQLNDITVNGIRFELNGETYQLDGADVEAANTWAELQAALQADIDATEGLEGLTVEHQSNGQFVVKDPAAGDFVIDPAGTVISSSTTNEVKAASLGVPQVTELPTETNVVLDGAGNGSQGGAMNVGVMSGDRGVEVFNVDVVNDSHLAPNAGSPNAALASTNLRTSEEYLEEVYVEGEGSLSLGTKLPAGANTDDRLANNGLVDVRVFDASGFEQELKVGARLTSNVDDRYLADAEDTVEFDYLLGDGGSNLSLGVNNSIAADPDFALNIAGGAGDDRINLTGLQFKNSTEIDGKDGDNTVEVTTTTGAIAGGNTAEENSWEAFNNVQTLVVAGSNNTVQNLVVGNMEGLEDITVATTGGVDTDLQQMSMDQDLTISGKNQTLGSGNSDNDQDFGDIDVTNTSGVSGVDSFEVLLDNTARVSGEMQVDSLNVVDSTTVGGSNDISTLDLTSSGRRQTENLVKSAALAGVDTVNLDGSQNLDLHIAAMEVDGGGNSTDSTVDGSELGGDLDLAMNANILNGANDVLTGTDADTDRLLVYGTNAQASVKDFETVQLGLAAGNQFNGSITNFAGTFDAAAVSGVEQYDVEALGAATTIDNLGGSEVVNVATATADQDLTLVAANRSGSSEVDVNFDDVAPGNGWANGTNTLTVQDIRTVNLDLEKGDYDFGLDLLGGAADTYARTLNITGGDDQPTLSSLDIGELDTALTTIDISNFTGALEGASWDSLTGSNGKILGNAYDLYFDVGGDNTKVSVPAAGSADTNEVNEIDYSSTADNLDVGASITINFAGGEYTYTNDTGVVLSGNAISAAIVADAANAPDAFDIAISGNNVQLTANVLGDVPNATVTTTDAGLGVPTVTETAQGDRLAGASTITDTTSDFITEFKFDDDAAEAGVVWQIDNFQASEAGTNIDLSNQSVINLTSVGGTGDGVNSLGQLDIQDANAFWTGLSAAEQSDYTNNGYLAGDFAAGDTVITSNEDLNFTILLNGVNYNDLDNANLAGIGA